MKIVKNILIKPVFVWTTFESIKRIDGWRRKPADIDVQRNYATVTPSVYTGAVGTSTVMFVYAAACGVSLVFIAACVPETKDRSLEQVDDAVATQQRRLLRLYVIHPPNQLPAPLRQPRTNLSNSASPYSMSGTSSIGSIDSPLSSSITPSLFHSRLKTFLFCKSFPP